MTALATIHACLHPYHLKEVQLITCSYAFLKSELFLPCAYSYGWYFTFVQGFTVKQMVNPWRTYVRLSAVLMGSNGLTKGSLAFLNYPAQIMFKSTKVKNLPLSFLVLFLLFPIRWKMYTALKKCWKNNANVFSCQFG